MHIPMSHVTEMELKREKFPARSRFYLHSATRGDKPYRSRGYDRRGAEAVESFANQSSAWDANFPLAEREGDKCECSNIVQNRRRTKTERTEARR